MIDPVAELLHGDADGWVASEVLLERVLAAEPGPDVMRVLALLDPSELGEGERVRYLQAWERQQAWVAARQQGALVAVAGKEAQESDDWAREDVRVALRLSAMTAQRRVDIARVLATALPATLAALECGRIGYAHAAALAEAVEGLEPELAAQVEARVLERADRQTVGELRRAARRAVATLDPVREEVACAQATAKRSVQHWPEEHGMAALLVTGPAADIQTIFLAADARARRAGEDDPRGIDARRFDALVETCAGALADPSAPRAHGRRASVQVVIDLPTLLGLADIPGELAGYGPIPASVARALAADGEWRRLVTDPVTGHLLDYGRTTYRPPQELADFLLARDRVCRFPTCAQPAYRCDLDHAVPWDDGGTTCPGNCGPLCRRHHRLKTLGRWDVDSHPDGSCTWTGPGHQRYEVPATRHPPAA